MIFNLYELVKAKPEYFKQLTCKAVLVTQYDCQQVDNMQDIFSHMNSFTYVISGRRKFFQPGYHIEMTEGKCVFAKKGGWLVEKKAGDGWCVLVFFIPDEYLRHFFRDYQVTLPVKEIQKEATRQMIELEVNETTESCFDSMAAYFMQAAIPSENLLELKFREMLLNLLGNPGNKELLIYFKTLAANDRQPLEEIMEANYTYNLSLEEFAKIAYRSLASFKREFNVIFKISPGRWLIQKRLDYASTLLQIS